MEDGDRVAAFGVYSGTYKATSKSMRAPFAHLYEIKNGKIARMTQYVDTVLVQRALVP
jgi:ketosteroid isomerase-like protein